MKDSQTMEENMHTNTKEKLAKIHNIQGGKELAGLCDEIYAMMTRTDDKSVVSLLLDVNYIFYMDEEVDANNILKAFKDFLVAAFELVDESDENEIMI